MLLLLLQRRLLLQSRREAWRRTSHTLSPLTVIQMGACCRRVVSGKYYPVLLTARHAYTCMKSVCWVWLQGQHRSVRTATLMLETLQDLVHAAGCKQVGRRTRGARSCC